MTTSQDSTSPTPGSPHPQLVPQQLATEVWEQCTDGLHVHDAQGIYRQVNPAYCAMVGYSPEELLGKSFLVLVPPAYRDMYAGLFESVITRRDSGASGEFHVQGKDGRLIKLLVRHTLLQAGSESLHLFVSRDITTQRALEQHLLSTERMRTLGALAGGCAHEFNNLLVSILGYAELMIGNKVSQIEVLREYAAKIQRAARRGCELTGQLLPFARPESQVKRPVDLHQVMQEAAQLVRLSAPATPLQLELEAEPALVLGDALQLQHVFVHIFLGAAGARSDEQPVRVRTRVVQEPLRRGELHVTPSAFVLIEVSPQPTRPASRNGQSGGELDLFDERTGLSLALVHGSIESHGGSMSHDQSWLQIRLPALTAAGG